MKQDTSALRRCPVCPVGVYFPDNDRRSIHYPYLCIGFIGLLIQYLKTFKKFSLGAELQPLRASPIMSFPQKCRFLEVVQGGGWRCGPEQPAAMVPCANVYSGLGMGDMA